MVAGNAKGRGRTSIPNLHRKIPTLNFAKSAKFGPPTGGSLALRLINLHVVVDSALEHRAIIRAAEAIELVVYLGAAGRNHRQRHRSESRPLIVRRTEGLVDTQRRKLGSTGEI